MLVTSRETYIVKLLSDLTDFRVTVVKPYLKELNTLIDSPTKPPKEDSSEQDSSYSEENRHTIDDNQNPSEDALPRRNSPHHRYIPTRF